MRLIEVMVTMGANGILKISEPELERMGIQEGNQICLSYLAQEDDSWENEAKEFLVEKAD